MTANEAKQNFSRILGEAEAGETITILRHGHTVAKLVPSPDKDVERARRVAAAEDLVALMRSFEPVTIGPCTCDELYDAG
jgi:prevent-host-death family protein